MPAGSVEAAVDAARFQGKVCRTLAEWDQAVVWYGIARRVAEEGGDARRLATVLDGLANTHRDRGNLPKARGLLADVLALGVESGDRYSRAIAHHDLMTVEKLAGNLEEAVLQGWEAVQLYDAPEGRLRALFDLAGVLREGGDLSASWDAYSVVAAQVENYDYRVLSLDALALLSALQGDEAESLRLRGAVDAQGWEDASVVVRSQILYFRGMACRALGREDEAGDWFGKALALAEEHRLNKMIFDAEKALEGKVAFPEKVETRSPYLGGVPQGGIGGVRRGLRELREAQVTAGGLP